MAAYPFQLPTGKFIDLQNCSADVDQYNNVVVTESNGNVTKIPHANTMQAKALLNAIAVAAGAPAIPTFGSVQWSTDQSTWQNFPVPSNTAPVYLQLNGTNLPSAGTPYIETNPATVQFNAFSASGTQITSSGFFAAIAPGTYDLLLYDTTNVLVMTVPGVMTFM